MFRLLPFLLPILRNHPFHPARNFTCSFPYDRELGSNFFSTHSLQHLGSTDKAVTARIHSVLFTEYIGNAISVKGVICSAVPAITGIHFCMSKFLRKGSENTPGVHAPSIWISLASGRTGRLCLPAAYR